MKPEAKFLPEPNLEQSERSIPRDYFAEMYVAGLLAYAGWNVYFPRRDKGFDFIVTKKVASGDELIRPVQVKGKYPLLSKGDKDHYGYEGKLTQLHDEMVLAIPYFPAVGAHPLTVTCVAFLPKSLIKKHPRGYRAWPASFKDGVANPRRDFAKFFDDRGIAMLDMTTWNQVGIGESRS